MGMFTERTEPSLADVVANAVQRPALDLMAEMMQESAMCQTELLKQLLALPKSESRRAWEAVHPSFGQMLADACDVAERYWATGMLPVRMERRSAGCRL